MLILFCSVAIGIGMHLMPSGQEDIAWHPYPFAQAVSIHPQSWYHMGYLRFKGMLSVLAISILWNPKVWRYWFMLAVFFALEVADVIDYLFRYGYDFSPDYPGIDMHTIKIPIYLVLVGYNIWRTYRQMSKYAKE